LLVDGFEPDSRCQRPEVRCLFFVEGECVMVKKMTGVILVCLVLFLITCGTRAFSLDRGELLFYASLDGTTTAEFARGSREALPGYVPKYDKILSGTGAVVGRDTGLVKILDRPIPYWLDVDIARDYVDKNIGALRWSGKDNISPVQGTLSFRARPLDWKSGGADRFLAHFNTEKALNFVWAPYYGTLVYHATAKSDRDTYRQLRAYGKMTPDETHHFTIAWEPGRTFFWINGRHIGIGPYPGKAVPEQGSVSNFLALGSSDDYHTVFSDVLVLAKNVDHTEAKALYLRGKESPLEPVITIPEVSKPPYLDGKVQDREKEQMTIVRGWNDAILRIANDDKTEAFICYDERALYVSFAYPIPEKFRKNRDMYVGQPLEVKAQKRDDKRILSDDHFKIMLSPDEGRSIYTFAANGKALRYDARNGDASWNADWRFKTSLSGYLWQAEFAIPFAAIGITRAAPGNSIDFNLSHRSVRVDDIDSIWVTLGRTRRPLGTLIFGGAEKIKVEKLSNPSGGSVEAKLKLDGFEQKKLKAVAEVATDKELEKHPGERVEGGLGPDGAVSFDFSLDEPLAADFILSVADEEGNIHYRQRLPFVFTVGATAQPAFLPSLDELVVKLDAGSESLVKRGLSADVKIVDSGNKVIGRQMVEKFSSVVEEIEFDTRDYPVGRYKIDTTFRSGQGELPKIAKFFEKKEKPVWLGNNLGYSDRVPWPWKEMTATAESFSCWGRTYFYEEGVFPSQIRILDEDILAAPMKLTLGSGGDSFADKDVRLDITATKPVRIEYSCNGKLGDFEVETRNWVEFDGFMWVKLKISPARRKKIDKLTLEIPFKKKYASHWYSGQYPVESKSGYTPDEEYIDAPASFVRIGGYERGIQWCWQSLRGWKLKEPKKAMRFIPAEDTYIVEFTIVDHPVVLKKPLEIELGLQALPCRPFPAKGIRGNWWHWAGHKNWDKWPSIGPRVEIGSHQGQWNPHWNYLNLSDKLLDALLKSGTSRWKAYNYQPGFYVNHSYTDANTPEYKYFAEEWRAAPSSRPDFASFEDDPKKIVRTAICYGAKSYEDFYVYYLHKFVHHLHDPEGMPVALYFDCTSPPHCSNKYHGHGYLGEDGKWHGEKQILSWRSACKRIYYVMKEMGHNNWITTHMSGQPHMAYWSFSDVMIPGEQWAAYMVMKKAQYKAEGKKWPLDYTLTLPMERFRAEFSPWAYGPQTSFLTQSYSWLSPEDTRGYNTSLDPYVKGPAWPGYRHFTGINMVHDAVPYGGWRPYIDLFPALIDFGWDDEVTCLPYWRNQEYVALDVYDPDKVVATLFKRPDKLMVLAFNNTDGEVTAKITLNIDKLGFSNMRDGYLLDMEDQERIALKGETAAVPIRARDFRVLVLRK